jgi:hypothetical protein
MNITQFITKNQTLILAAGGVLIAAYVIRKLTPSGKVGEKLNTLAEGLTNPVDALFANVGILPPNKSSVQLTPRFQAYIDRNGGIEKYIADHKNGTFKAPAFGATGSW